ncbi:sterile alpha motif domain-containing protein 1 [Ovis canadensis]|uniref:sterile alpha motif domain-containing protein 1 n=1 Tax=Ovis canadensis TaxID=37174 RepID=UPI003752CF33
MYVRGPQEAALSQARGQSKGCQRPCQPPASHTRPPRCPGRSEGFPASRGLVAPHALPASRGTRGGRSEAPPTPRPSRGVGRRPPRQDAPSARPEDLPPGPSWATEGQRARDRAAPHSPRAAAAAASAWPGGSSPSRQPPPEGTGPAPGAAAKPPTPAGAEVAAVAEARRPPDRIGLPGRRSHADPAGAPLSRAGGARLRRDDRGAAGGDPPRSLQRRRGRSCRRRRWATAPPGPHARLRRRDCGGRQGTSEGT